MLLSPSSYVTRWNVRRRRATGGVETCLRLRLLQLSMYARRQYGRANSRSSSDSFVQQMRSRARESRIASESGFGTRTDRESEATLPARGFWRGRIRRSALAFVGGVP